MIPLRDSDFVKVTWESPYHFSAFEHEVIDFALEIASTVIEKNRKYGDSYRITRIDAGKNLPGEGSELDKRKAPYWLHINEKVRRYLTAEPGDTEDPLLDAGGYCILEYVCGKLDDCNLK